MAFTPYHNILGATAATWALLTPGDNASDVQSILLTNVHATADATVSLHIEKLSSSSNQNAPETYYILKTVAIPSDTALLLDNASLLSFNNSVNGHGLYITVGATDTVDVLVNI